MATKPSKEPVPEQSLPRWRQLLTTNGGSFIAQVAQAMVLYSVFSSTR